MTPSFRKSNQNLVEECMFKVWEFTILREHPIGNQKNREICIEIRTWVYNFSYHMYRAMPILFHFNENLPSLKKDGYFSIMKDSNSCLFWKVQPFQNHVYGNILTVVLIKIQLIYYRLIHLIRRYYRLKLFPFINWFFILVWYLSIL